MISGNNKCRDGCRKLRKNPELLALYQAFAEVGRNFEVIDEDTVSVIVPYGNAEEVILTLNGETDMKTRIRKIREAQSYSVSVYRSSFYRKIDDLQMV